MSIMKYNKKNDPFRELTDIRNAFKNLIDGSIFGEGAATFPRVDLYEKEGRIHLEAELPGMKKEDIRIELEDGVLTVSGNASASDEKKSSGYYMCERRSGSFSRSFEVPKDARPEDISAEYADGILRVSLPKPEKPNKTKLIDIK